MEDLKVTIVQTSLHWENKNKNLEWLTSAINNINEETDLIILPEMFSTAFTMNASGLAEDMNGAAIQWMKNISKEKKCIITGSMIIEENRRYFNRLIWMSPHGMTFYDKRHLFILSREGETFTGGNKKMVMEIKGWKILPLICYDLRFPVWSRRTKEKNYDLLLYVANWPERRVFAWKSLLVARAIENQCYVAGVNRIGEDGNGIYHSGESAVIDYKGEKLSGESTGNEFTETIVLKYDELIKFREQFGFFNDADDFVLNG